MNRGARNGASGPHPGPLPEGEGEYSPRVSEGGAGGGWSEFRRLGRLELWHVAVRDMRLPLPPGEGWGEGARFNPRDRCHGKVHEDKMPPPPNGSASALDPARSPGYTRTNFPTTPLSAPPPPSSSPILSLEELHTLLPTRPAAIVLGPAIASSLSGRSVVLKDLLQSGLRLAFENFGLKEKLDSQLLANLDSFELLRRISVGSMLETASKSKKGLLADWLQKTIGPPSVANPAVAAPLLSAAQSGFALASATYDGLLEMASGLKSMTWLEFHGLSQLLNPPTLLRLYGAWDQPESIVRALPGASGTELHRRAIDTFLNDLQLVVTLGAAVPFGEDPLVEGLKRRGESLPGVVVCRDDEVEAAQAFLAEHLPWFRIAPYSGGNEALPEVLASLFGTAPLPLNEAFGTTPLLSSIDSVPPVESAESSAAIAKSEEPLPSEFLELAHPGERLARFLARLTLRHREGLPLLETLEAGRLADALRPANVLAATSPVDFAERTLSLEKSLDPSFEPPPLWLAWMQNVRRSELSRLSQELVALAERTTTTSPPVTQTPSPTSESAETLSSHAETLANMANMAQTVLEQIKSTRASKAPRRKTRGTPPPPPPPA
jgi:hypothetical protein